tara:strand:- start:131 stop:328 length:198 start_codon:yes stop_codon:yes gene_type:complete
MNVGDLVRLRDVYPMWILSVGLGRKGLGIVTKVFEETDEVEVYWFIIFKCYTIKQNLISLLHQKE